MPTRFEECRARVLGQADYLVERIKAGKLNDSAFERLMESYIDMPGFDPTFRRRLLDLALERFDGRPRPAPPNREEAP